MGKPEHWLKLEIVCLTAVGPSPQCWYYEDAPKIAIWGYLMSLERSFKLFTNYWVIFSTQNYTLQQSRSVLLFINDLFLQYLSRIGTHLELISFLLKCKLDSVHFQTQKWTF